MQSLANELAPDMIGVNSKAVLFLAFDEARYITGVTLPVDACASVK
jgi:hypothetical protein